MSEARTAETARRPCTPRRCRSVFLSVGVVLLGALFGPGHALVVRAQVIRWNFFEPGDLLVTKAWPTMRLTIKGGSDRGHWLVSVQFADTDRPSEFDIAATTLRPSEAYLLRDDLVAVECDAYEDTGVGELVLLNVRTGEMFEHIYEKMPTVSPDGRYLLFERQNARFEEDHVGSVLLLYDVTKTPKQNRPAFKGPGEPTPIPIPSTKLFDPEEHVSIGVPAYPNYFRKAVVYKVPLGSAEGGGTLMMPRPEWVDDHHVVFGYRQGAKVLVVMLTIDEGGTVARVTEKALDVDSYGRPGSVPAIERVKIEEIKLVSAGEEATRVRLRLGPAYEVSVRWVDVDLK